MPTPLNAEVNAMLAEFAGEIERGEREGVVLPQGFDLRGTVIRPAEVDPDNLPGVSRLFAGDVG
jgi:hypothetical protein